MIFTMNLKVFRGPIVGNISLREIYEKIEGGGKMPTTENPDYLVNTTVFVFHSPHLKVTG